MMGWYRDCAGWGSWVLMTAIMVAFWALVVFAVVKLFRGGQPLLEQTPDHRDPMLILNERFARGEIDDAEYHARIAALVLRADTCLTLQDPTRCVCGESSCSGVGVA